MSRARPDLPAVAEKVNPWCKVAWVLQGLVIMGLVTVKLKRGRKMVPLSEKYKEQDTGKERGKGDPAVRGRWGLVHLNGMGASEKKNPHGLCRPCGEAFSESRVLAEAYRVARRRRMRPMPTSAAPIRAIVVGSGTASVSS